MANNTRAWGSFGLAILSLPISFLASCEEGPADRAQQPGKSNGGDDDTSEPVTVEALAAERERLDATVFASEVDAQAHEQVFVGLWDRLRSGSAFEVLKAFPFGSIDIGTATPSPPEDWGVPGMHLATLAGPRNIISRGEFLERLESFESSGWRIAQSEWHHTKFEPATGDIGARSTVGFEIDALFRTAGQRLIIRGDLKVAWKKRTSDEKDEKGEIQAGVPEIESIDASGVQLIARKGKPMLATMLVFDPKLEVPQRYPRTSPILLRDLNGDGLSEIVLAGCNVVLRNDGNFSFTKMNFLKHGVTRPSEAGILADFTGDGIDDFIGGSLDDGSLLLFEGRGGGTFPDRPKKCIKAALPNLHALTAGDIDGDGDLDLFAGQWKAPYQGGAMPTPYYDANDGLPDYLLRNDGKGNFTDITASSGLAAKRNRRTFSASFVDLNDDHLLDLVVVADFSGLDLYQNKGKGIFEDTTASTVDERHSFGMSHRIDDWNGDGKLDLYMVGMSSTTARRLDSLGVGRPGHETYDKMRAPMSFGNRLYLQGENGRLEQNAYTATAARSGWSWGCTSADFDLDGDADLYVANGHLSGNSAKDYCTKFWCHDLYTGNSKPNPVIDSFFTKELGAKLGNEFSWNGFEHNVLFLNQAGKGFFNASFLLGTAFEFDSRAAVSDDLDGDRRPDLLVVEYRTDTQSQQLHVLRNQLQTESHWTGVRFAPGAPVIGAKVVVTALGRKWVKPIVTGDSFTAQHAPVAHIGLGDASRIDSLEVIWPSGKTTKLENPELDRYHLINNQSP